MLHDAYGYGDGEISYCSGVMGVPITFLDKYCPEQFDVIGVFNHGKDGPWDFAPCNVSGVAKYKRLAIRRYIYIC